MHLPANLPYFYNYLLSDDYVLSLQWTLNLNFLNAQRYIIAKSDVHILRKLQRAYIGAESLLESWRADRGISKEPRIKLKYEL